MLKKIKFNENIFRNFTTTRLEILRKQLKDEEENITTEIIKTKGSKKNLPKPSWLKAEVPKGENYEHLRNTGKQKEKKINKKINFIFN